MEPVVKMFELLGGGFCIQNVSNNYLYIYKLMYWSEEIFTMSYTDKMYPVIIVRDGETGVFPKEEFEKFIDSLKEKTKKLREK